MSWRWGGTSSGTGRWARRPAISSTPGVEFGKLSYRGSNEMLIGPKRTAMNAPIAIIDPHVHWYDAFRFYEVRIYTPEYNASGVTILGVPLPSLGHSRWCSVAMTTGGPDTSDIFEEEINPANPSQYRYDGQWRDLTVREVTIGVKNGDKVEQRHVPLARSHHGPIVARKNGKAYAMALPYENEVGLTDQCYADDDGPESRGNEAGPLAPPAHGPEHHGRHGPGRHLLPAQRPGAGPARGRRSRPADPGEHLGHRMEGNPPDVRPGPDREPALRLDAELQLLARRDDEPGPAGAESLRGSSLPVQRVSLARRPPARGDGDGPARRRRQGDRRAGHRDRLQHPGLARRALAGPARRGLEPRHRRPTSRAMRRSFTT